MNTQEQWKEIPDHPQYWVSSFGRVWSEKTHKFLSQRQATQTDLHQKVRLQCGNQSKDFFIHRLVMLTFSPIDNPNDLQVNHIDGNPQNNRLENLEWVTEKENHQHYKNKLIPQRKAEGKCNLGRKPNIIKVEFENGQVNYYAGIEEVCEHLQISDSTFLRWKAQGTPVKISYTKEVPECHINAEFQIAKKSIPRAVKVVYKDYESFYENGREADRALGLKEGTINLWAKRETNKQTPTMKKLGILRVEFAKI